MYLSVQTDWHLCRFIKHWFRKPSIEAQYSDIVSTNRTFVGLLFTVGIFSGYAYLKFTLALH